MKKSILSLISLVLFSLTAGADPWLGNTQTLAADTEYQFRPAVAYNSVHDEYLVVWHADVTGVNEIVGVRVDSEGLPIGSSFRISDPGINQFQPDVAYDPVNDRYFVVWVLDFSGDLTDTDIAGRFIPWNGPDPADQAFFINWPGTMQSSPSVSLTPGVGEFMVVWGDAEDGSPASISAQRWAVDGSGATTPAMTITSGPEYRVKPKLVWNTGTLQYLVVYERFTDDANHDVWGTRLSWSGGILGSEIGVAGWLGQEGETDVASCRGDYLVAWTGGESTTAQVFARAVSGDGTVGAIVSNLSDPFDGQSHPSVACNEGGAEYLVSMESLFTPGNRGVVGAFVELNGETQGTFNIYFGGSGFDFTRPGLAFGNDAKALVAWESDRPDLTSQDIRGRLVGGRIFVDGFESGDSDFWSDS